MASACGEVVAVQAEPADAHEHAAPDRARAQRAHAARHLDGGAAALAAQVGEQLAQVERVAAGGLVAGPAQLLVGARAQLAAHELAAGGLAQRRGLEHEARALADSAVSGPDTSPRRCATTSTAGSELDAAGQIEQEPRRGLVKPVRVVHEQRHRALVTAVGDQPVEAVQHRDGAVGLRRDVGLAHEHRRGEPRRAAERVRPDGGRQQLAHRGERGFHRHVVAAGVQALHAQLWRHARRRRAAARSCRCRADPRSPPGRRCHRMRSPAGRRGPRAPRHVPVARRRPGATRPRRDILRGVPPRLVAAREGSSPFGAGAVDRPSARTRIPRRRERKGFYMQTFRLRSLRAYLYLAGAAAVITVAVAVLASDGDVASAHTSRVLVNDSHRLASVSPTIPAKVDCSTLTVAAEPGHDPALPDEHRLGHRRGRRRRQPGVLRRQGDDRAPDALRDEVARQHLAGPLPAERMRRLLRIGHRTELPVLRRPAGRRLRDGHRRRGPHDLTAASAAPGCSPSTARSCATSTAMSQSTRSRSWPRRSSATTTVDRPTTPTSTAARTAAARRWRWPSATPPTSTGSSPARSRTSPGRSTPSCRPGTTGSTPTPTATRSSPRRS